MNREINYLIEYLAKSNDPFFKVILEFFKDNSIYIPTKYEAKTIKVLADKSGFEIGNTSIDKLLNKELNKNLLKAKEQIFETIIKTNFKKNRDQFDKVETSIYKCLEAYISSLSRAFGLFIIYAKDEPPELFVKYANILHVELLNTIFNDEEIVLLEDKLREVMSVYIALYAKYMYV